MKKSKNTDILKIRFSDQIYYKILTQIILLKIYQQKNKNKINIFSVKSLLNSYNDPPRI